MAYRDFKLSDLEDKFGITQHQIQLFDSVEPITPSLWLIETLRKKRKGIRATTEKAVSESTISAILTEVQELNEDKQPFFRVKTSMLTEPMDLMAKLILFLSIAQMFLKLFHLLSISQKLNSIKLLKKVLVKLLHKWLAHVFLIKSIKILLKQFLAVLPMPINGFS